MKHCAHVRIPTDRGGMTRRPVVTGFGRTGRWFAMEHFGVQADIMTIAKGMASCALPLGGVVVSDRVNQPFLEGVELLHGFTYQGHAAACAAGIAT